jgi:hypothetical protein
VAIYVFCGPSIAPAEVRALRPDVEVAAPIKRGDLLRRRLSRDDTAIIIDGYFFYTAAIQHMEILDAIDRGTTVIGASSMGALRAAELHPLGMIGVGRIFEQLRDGALIADDEVTLLHDPDSYVCHTESLVNLRHNLRAACAGGVIGEPAAELAIDRLARTWFGDRTRGSAFRLLREAGFDDDAARLQAHWARQFFDVKRADAREALAAAPPPPPPAARLPATVFSHLIREDYTFVDDDLELPEVEVVHYCQVAEPDMPAIYRRTALLQLLDLASRRAGEPPAPADDRYDAAVRRADAAARAGIALDELCRHALIACGVLDAGATAASVEALALPVLVAPGQPIREFLTIELERRGVLQRAAQELAGFIRDRLSGRLTADVIRHGRSHRDHVVRLYTGLWDTPADQLGAAARCRGFRDVEDLVHLGGRIVITAKLAADRAG